MAEIDPEPIYFKSDKQKQRDAFLSDLRDYQWDLHLRSTANVVKQNTVDQALKLRQSIKVVRALQKDYKKELATTQHQILPANVAAADLSLLQGLNLTGADINFDSVARTVLGSDNVISREREASGAFRRFVAWLIDSSLMYVWMLGWIYYFYLQNIYVLNNLSKFITEEWDEILRNSMVQDPEAGEGPLDYDLSADNIDLDKLADGFYDSKYINGIEDDLILFFTFLKIMSVFYETVFIWYFGCTLGKRLAGIEVVHYSSFASGGGNGVNATPDVMVIHNSNMTLLRSFARSLIKTMYFTVVFPVLLFVTPFNTWSTQFYDRATKTMVVKRLRNNNNNINNFNL